MRGRLRRLHALAPVALVALTVGAGCPDHPTPSAPQPAAATATATATATPAAPAPAPATPAPTPEPTAQATPDGPTVDAPDERYQVAFDPTRPFQGGADAPVTIVVFCDTEAAPCALAVKVLAQQVRDFGDQIRVQFRHYPALSMRRGARPLAALASLFAESQPAAFWRVQQALLAAGPIDAQQAVTDILARVRLDTSAFITALGQGTLENALAADVRAALLLGVKRLPTMVVNGRRVSGGILGTDALAQLIRDELATAARGDAPAPRPAATGAGHAISPVIYRVPLNGATRGSREARVTLVAFLDYTCASCTQVPGLLERLTASFGDDLRLVVRHNPLSISPHAMAAAETVEAARAQGRFWELHERLLRDPGELTPARLADHVAAVGLDPVAIAAARDAGVHRARVRADRMTAWRLGVRGAPHYFVNGRSVAGADVEQALRAVISDERAAADVKLARGTLPHKIYAALTENGELYAAAPGADAGIMEANPDLTYRVEIGDAPTLGPPAAPVTAVIWGDFESLTTRVALRHLLAAKNQHGEQLRLVWRDLPHPDNDLARPAANAARAAHAAGHFWALVRALAAIEGPLDRTALNAALASAAPGVDAQTAVVAGPPYDDAVSADVDRGHALGAVRNPTIFVNGRYLPGAGQDRARLMARIDAALAMPPRRYSDIIANGLARSSVITGPGFPGADPAIYQVAPGAGPWTGMKDSDVDVVVFSSFTSPHAKAVAPVLERLVRDEAVRLTWRSYPQPKDDVAQLAAEAFAAAHAQGMAWPFHDRLFAHQQDLSRDALVAHAEAVGLDVARFTADLDGRRYREAVDTDFEYGLGIAKNALGTPTVFIGGRMIMGAHPYETYADVVRVIRAQAP